MQRDAQYKTWYMRGVSYAILTPRNSRSVGYLLHSLETFHSITTEKSIRLLTDVAILGHVVRDKTKKDDAPKQLYYQA
jgi:hypothetical protein